jgi:hypothetical protein
MTGAAGRSTSTDLDEGHERHEGGIAGFFHPLFCGDESESYGGQYAEAVRRGNAVVCVTGTENQIDNAVQMMNEAGAVDVDRHVANYRSEGYERHDPNAPPYSYEEANRERARFHGSQDSTAIPVIEQELQVGKRTVRRGGVRVYSHVVEQPVEETVELPRRACSSGAAAGRSPGFARRRRSNARLEYRGP